MRITVIGIGGIGGFIGGKLACAYAGSGKHEICFVCRGKHLEKIKREGLELITPEGRFLARPDLATSDPSDLGKVDLLIFAVKGYDLDSAAMMTLPCVTEHTTIIPFLNGVGNSAVLKEILPDAGVLNGCVYISARKEGPGVVRQTGGAGKFVWGPENGDIKPFGEIQHLFEGAGINSTLSENITLDAWKKFMFMSPYAGVTSVKEKTFGEVLDDGESFALLERMVSELAALGKALGVPLGENIVEDSINIGRNFPPETKSSMQLDVEKGGKNELELFIGYVVDKASALGLESPSYKYVYDALK